MQITDSPGRIPAGTTTTGSLPRATLLAEWPKVRIEQVQSEAVREGEPTVIRARVHLGGLLPVDVHVDVLCDEERVAPREAPRSSCDRLWSVHSYDNGAFLFEGRVPASALEGPHGYAIRVMPTSHPADASEPAPVVRWITPRRVVRETRPGHVLGRASVPARSPGLLPRQRA